MQVIHPDAFALKNSGLNASLYADVGAELNGSTLTILSMIARLGLDPWAEAARWAVLPRAGVIDSLARSIAQMPLVPSASAASRVTAERLVQLLPATTQSREPGSAAKAQATSVPPWLQITLLYSVLAVGMALNALSTPKPPFALATPVEQPAALVAGSPAALVTNEIS